jgi:hypothetical protein
MRASSSRLSGSPWPQEVADTRTMSARARGAREYFSFRSENSLKTLIEAAVIETTSALASVANDFFFIFGKEFPIDSESV